MSSVICKLNKSNQVYNLALAPELTSLKLGTPTLDWSLHAARRAEEKGIRMDCQLVPDLTQVVEAEFVQGKPKLVIRVRRADGWDDCLVLLFEGPNSALVLTCWRNHRNDTHQTLNKSRLAG